MSVRGAFVLGIFILLAALVRGGIFAAGHDFVVNRFTGQFQFVPAEDESEDQTPIDAASALTARRGKARVDRSGRGGTRWRAIRVGR